MVTFIATSFALISSLSSLLYNNKASYYDIWYVKMYIVNIVDGWIIVFSQNTSSVAVATNTTAPINMLLFRLCFDMWKNKIVVEFQTK